jgi:hypothetical protein
MTAILPERSSGDECVWREPASPGASPHRNALLGLRPLLGGIQNSVTYKGRHCLPAGSCAPLGDRPLFIFHSEHALRCSAGGRAIPLSFVGFFWHAVGRIQKRVADKGRHRLPAGSCASLRDPPLSIFHSEVSDRGSAVGRAAPLSFASFFCHAGSLGPTRQLSRIRKISGRLGGTPYSIAASAIRFRRTMPL